jgi:hypothetical protein
MDDPTRPDNDSLDLPKTLKRDPVTNRAEYMVMSDTEEMNETKGKVRLRARANSQTKSPKLADKVKKTKPAKETKTTKEKTKVVRDQFGLRKGSARSEAAAMYARKSGATLAEVKERVGSIQLNVLTALEKDGWIVEKSAEKHDNQRPVTRYRLKSKT